MTPKKQDPIHVVGIGASAGGIEALQQFFTQMPATSGLAFVIIMHLSPTYDSQLASLLQPLTAMPVTQVQGPTPLLPNQVYVIPPNHNLSALDTHLRLAPLEEARRARAPIDHFFRTLAAAQGEQAIGIILSGTGSDGAVGLTRIKEDGGLTLVQQPADAAYDGMPQSAIATGLVDLILPIAAMPAHLLAYTTTTPHLSSLDEADPVPADEHALLQDVFQQLRTQTGHDFARYKSATLLRRMQRRMQMQQIQDLPTYLDWLRQHAEEAQTLSQDFLISVTNFFRDPEAFALLEQQVIPALFTAKTAADTVRLWVAGCATGEEAYSLGILLLEAASQLSQPPQLHIFATDLNARALQQARTGLYPAAIQGDVSPARLARYFHADQGGYRVNSTLRELVTFAPHNLLKDPPFSKVDLLSCRNLLIYLQREVQQELFGLFHYALCPDGHLWLGSAESLTEPALFRTLSKAHSLFQRQTGHTRLPPPVSFLSATPPRGLAWPMPGERPSGLSAGMLHHRLVELYAPPSLVVNADYRIVHLSEHVGQYLQEPGGEPTRQLLKRIRPELRLALTQALDQALAQQTPVVVKPLPLVLAGQHRSIRITVQPTRVPELHGHVLISFQELAVPDAGALDEPPPVASGLAPAVADELAATQDRLQTALEQFELAKEGMRAEHEELLSMNEELRSTTEELETGKEELQSINEELLTVNQENKHKVEELSQLTSRLQNLMAATEIATLFLDRALCIQWFTPRASDLFNIILADQGRPLAHLTHKLGAVDLLADAAHVLQTLIPQERELQSISGHWYLLRILPYRTTDDYIAGVVLTFVEISALKAAAAALQESAAQFRRAITAAPMLMVMYTEDGAILALSDLALQLTPYTRTLLPSFPEWVRSIAGAHAAAMVDRVTQAFQTNQALRDVEWAVTQPTKAAQTWLVSQAIPEALPDGRRYAVLIANDITARKQAEEALQAFNATLEQQVVARTAELERSNRELDQFAYIASHDLKAPLRAIDQLAAWIAADAQASLPPTSQEHLTKLRARTRRLQLLLADLLTYARVGHPPQAGVRVDTATVVRQQMAHLALPPGFTIQVAEGLPIFIGERVPLETVFRNLLGNSVKHHHQPATGEVQVTAQDLGSWLEFSVSDNGPGIDPADHRRIFEMFQTLKPRDEVEGSGLGLAFVKKVVEARGGTIQVESSLGQGTTFRFTWPKILVPSSGLSNVKP